VRRALRPHPLIGLAVLAACADRVDPFIADRVLTATPIGAPHLALTVGDPLLLEIASSAIPPDALLAQGPLGMPIELTPTLEDLELRVSEAGACATCVELNVQAVGRLRLHTSLFDASAIPWQATAGAPLRLESTVVDKGLRIDAQWTEIPVRSAVQLEQLPPTLEAIASGFIASWVQTTLTETLRERTPIATIDTAGLPLISLRAVPDDRVHLQAHLAVPVVVDALPTPPDPGDGWALVIPQAVAVALARHHALKDSDRSYFIEPTVIELDGSTLRAQLRVWRAGRRAHYKSILVEGIVSVREGDIFVSPTHAETYASMAWKGGLDTAILGAKLRKWVERGEIRIPAKLQTPWGHVRVQKVTGREGHVIVEGAFTPT